MLIHSRPLTLVLLLGLGACLNPRSPAVRPDEPPYERAETQELVALVSDAAELIQADGEPVFANFRIDGSRWRNDETYVFVLDLDGNMLVHPDAALEGKNQLNLRDVGGRPIVRGLLAAATATPGKPDGWYHYEWPVRGGLLPRWKSSYVRLVMDPTGERFVVGAGLYDDSMERTFVVDLVRDAAAQVEKLGEDAFPLFRDPRSRFRAKDTYVFVIDPSGVELVNPAFPNLEGRDLLGLRDTQGKPLVREMLEVAREDGSGWVDYMWPKPGESVSTEKSAYIRRVELDGRWLLVGAGVYLADAPKTAGDPDKLTAPELVDLVRRGAAILVERGPEAYREFRKRGSRWLSDDTYMMVWRLDGTREFHGADPTLEGKNGSATKDVLGRPYGRMFLDVANSPSGEGWVHYMYPEPGDIFPTWKSTFWRRVTLPSGEERLIGAGIYNMKMDRAFVVDVVERAAALVASRGDEAFAALRDKTGPFYFMDTYVFVDRPDGTELVNPAEPSLEGKNLRGLEDVQGKKVVRDYIDAALRQGAAWVDYVWFRPGDNTPARKQTYVRKVQAGDDVYIVGSGVYLDE